MNYLLKKEFSNFVDPYTLAINKNSSDYVLSEFES